MRTIVSFAFASLLQFLASPAIGQTMGTSELAFEANQGQTAPNVRFISRGPNWTLFLTRREMVLRADRPIREHIRPGEYRTTGDNGVAVRLSVVGGAPARIVGEHELPGTSNYLHGNNGRSYVGLPRFAAVRYYGILAGIDLVYYGNPNQLEHDFVVSPGADPANIHLRVDGAERVNVTMDGSLLLKTQLEDLRLLKPVAYQIAGNNVRRRVTAEYVLASRNTVKFRLGPYDRTKQLVIDPILSYSSFLGGSNIATGYGVAVDPSGNAYIAGTTSAVDFPTKLGKLSCTANIGDPTCTSYWQVFVSKFSPDGVGAESLVYSSYLGGGGTGIGNTPDHVAIAVDSTGHAYVSAATGDPNFPVTTGAYQTGCGSGPSPNNCNGVGFVSKVNPQGSGLDYSTLLGSSSSATEPLAVAVDSSGNAYIAGTVTPAFSTTQSFPTTSGAAQSSCPSLATLGYCFGYDGFVSKLNSTGSSLTYGSYIGGWQGGNGLSGAEWVNGIALDSSGNIYLAGITESTDFPTTTGINGTIAAYQQTAPQGDVNSYCATPQCPIGFLTKLNANGSVLYSTYVGGNRSQYLTSLAADGSGAAYLGFDGIDSTDFPHSPGAAQSSCATGPCSAVVKIDPTTGGPAGLKFATFIGSGGDQIRAIAVNDLGDAYLTGAAGYGFPLAVTSNALQPNCGDTVYACQDAFISHLNSAGTTLLYSSFLGGNGDEFGNAIAIDGKSNAYVTGLSSSPDFPVTASGFQTILNSNQGNAFITKLVEDPNAPSNLIASAVSGSEIDLSWSDNSLNEDQFLIEQSTDGTNFTQIVSVPTNAGTAAIYPVIGLAPGTQYWYRVRASNAAGVSAYSNIATAITPSGGAVTLSPTGINFGMQQVGGLYPIPQVQLTNSGTGPLTISSISQTGNNPGDFSQSNNCPISPNTLAATSHCTFALDFTPAHLGPLSAAISISDNAAGSPQTIALSGTAVDFSVSAVPVLNTIKGGKAASYTVSVAPRGGNTLTASLSVTGCPANTSCTLSASQFALNGSTATNSTLTVKGNGKTPSGTYTLTISGKVFTVTHSTTVTLVVQ